MKRIKLFENFDQNNDQQFDMFLKHIENPRLKLFLKNNPEYIKGNRNSYTWELASEAEYYERGEDWNGEINKNDLLDIYTDYVGYKAAMAYVNSI